jgi:hypothetical protein
VKTVNDQNKLHSLGANALAMALTDSDVRIAEEVLQLIKND